MGAIADATVAYARPLIDETDGSMEQVNNALQISTLCWNLSLMPEEAREKAIGDMRATLDMMNDAEFDEFRNKVIMPMIRRHEEMFPALHRRGSAKTERKPLAARKIQIAPPEETLPEETPPAKEQYAGTGRNDPCPCGSGKKYKRCCGQ
jgi:hypothetical protein